MEIVAVRINVMTREWRDDDRAATAFLDDRFTGQDHAQILPLRRGGNPRSVKECAQRLESAFGGKRIPGQSEFRIITDRVLY